MSSWFVGVVVDVAGAVLLLDATDAVHEAGRARDRPRAGERLRVAQVRPELAARGSARWRTARRCRAASSTSGSSHGSDAVGEVAVGEQDHRRAVLQRDADRLERGVEAVARRVRGDDRQRRLAVAAVHREQEVGLLGLGGQAGRRAAALHVDDHERELEADREPERLGLEVDAGTAGGGDPELTRERAADGNCSCRSPRCSSPGCRRPDRT